MRIVVAAALLGGVLVAQQGPSQPASEERLADLVQAYLWPSSDAEFGAAEAALNADASLTVHDARAIPRPRGGDAARPPHVSARAGARRRPVPGDRAVDERTSRTGRPGAGAAAEHATIRGPSGR